jgi:hypothetical protein
MPTFFSADAWSVGTRHVVSSHESGPGTAARQPRGIVASPSTSCGSQGKISPEGVRGTLRDARWLRTRRIVVPPRPYSAWCAGAAPA